MKKYLGLAGILAASLLYYAVWFAYLTRSKRVRATFGT